MTIDTQDNTTENDMRRQAAALRELVNSGDATPVQAERLSQLEQQIRRFEIVRNGHTW